MQTGGCHPRDGCRGPAPFAGAGFQYLAASTGFSLATLSYLRLTPELKPGNNNKLYVFALPVENSQK